MKTEIKKELDQTRLWLEIPKPYKETYEIRMLQKRQIPRLLPMESFGKDASGCYGYEISGKKSMKSRFTKKGMKKEDILQFTTELLDTVKTLRQFMLDPEGLILHPRMIYCSREHYYFCYLPVRPEDGKELKQTFHEMTEFFVRVLDYEIAEGIQLAGELHKATMQENYNLEKLLESCEEKEEEAFEEVPVEETGGEKELLTAYEELEGKIFDPVSEPELEDVETIREMGGWRNSLRRLWKKGQKKKWGEWEEFIMEGDRVEES